METLDRTPLPDDAMTNQDVRLGHAMQHAGLSITLTSLSSVIAFAIGSFADLPGISAFCFYACMAFLSNYGMFCLFFWICCFRLLTNHKHIFLIGLSTALICNSCIYVCMPDICDICVYHVGCVIL